MPLHQKTPTQMPTQLTIFSFFVQHWCQITKLMHRYYVTTNNKLSRLIPHRKQASHLLLFFFFISFLSNGKRTLNNCLSIKNKEMRLINLFMRKNYIFCLFSYGFAPPREANSTIFRTILANIWQCFKLWCSIIITDRTSHAWQN